MTMSHHQPSGADVGSGKDRTRRHRRLAVSAIAVTSGLTLAAYGGVSTAQPRTAQNLRHSSGLTGNLSLSVQTFGAPILAPVLKAFEAANPNLKVSEAVVSDVGTTYQTTLLTEKLAGDLPDILNPQDVLSPTLSTDGITQSLTPYLSKGDPYKQSYWLQNILASYIPDIGTEKGQVYALPNEADAVTIFYNENEFKAAGVPFPSDNWTWAQMLADAKKLAVVKDGVQTQWGLCDSPDWQAMYNPMINAFTGSPSLSQTSSNLGGSAGAIKAWEYLIAPTLDGEAVPYSTYLSESSNCTAIFDSGQAAMSVLVRGDLPTVRPAVAGKFVFNVAPMPFVPGIHGPTRPTGAGSIAWALSSQAKDVPNALAFFKFLFSTTGQQIEEKGYGVVPAIPSALQGGALWTKLPGPPDNVQAFSIAAKSGIIAPQTPGTVYSLSQVDIPKTIELVVDDHQSYKQAFTTLQNEITAAFAAAKKAGKS